MSTRLEPIRSLKPGDRVIGGRRGGRGEVLASAPALWPRGQYRVVVRWDYDGDREFLASAGDYMRVEHP